MKIYKYKAFISYSHKDEKFAKWLHKKLESYKIPKELYATHAHLPKKIFPIFRDVDELPASSDLSDEILEALNDSEYLIVICSPHSAESQWVNKEIIDFKSLHGEEKVLSIILDGEPYDEQEECFPEALKYKVVDKKVSSEKAEPIAADVRGKWRSEWEFGKLKLISGLLELDFEELNKREEKRRRKSRFVWGVVSLVIIASLSGLAWYSFVQKEKAEVAVYDKLIQKGTVYKNNRKQIESKLFFAHAISKSINQGDEENAKILYNTIKLDYIVKDIFEFEKPVNNEQIGKDGITVLEIKDNGTGIIKNKENLEKLYILYSNGAVISSKPIFIPLEWEIDVEGTLKILGLKKIVEKEVDFSKKLPNFEKYKDNMIDKNSKGVTFYDKKNDKKVFLDDAFLEAGIYNKSRSRILAWSPDRVSLWSQKSGKKLVEIINISEGTWNSAGEYSNDKDYKGATFSKNENKIIVWNQDGISEVYNLYEEISLVKKFYPLKTQVETGYYLTPSGEVKSLTAEEWREKKAQYEKILIKSKKE